MQASSTDRSIFSSRLLHEPHRPTRPAAAHVPGLEFLGPIACHASRGDIQVDRFQAGSFMTAQISRIPRGAVSPAHDAQGGRHFIIYTCVASHMAGTLITSILRSVDVSHSPDNHAFHSISHFGTCREYRCQLSAIVHRHRHQTALPIP